MRTPPTLDGRGLATFLLIAFAGAWLVVLPLWLSGRGLDTPGAMPLMAAMMFTPSLGVLVVTRWVRPQPGVLHATGIRAPGGIRGWWRYGLLAWLAPPVMVLATMALGAALGTYQPDLGLSGYRAQLAAVTGEPPPVPAGVLIVTLLAQALLLGWVNVIPALGEEWGWRGYLLPRLLPLGRWPALVLTGLVWGLWHAPVILLGYNYPLQSPPVALALMVVFCVLLGVLVGWLRLAAGSVWPSAIAHGFVNAWFGMPIVFAAAGTQVDNASAGLLGWNGWLVMALLITLVAAWWHRGAGSAAAERPAETSS